MKRGVDIRFGTRVVSLNDQETSLLCENGENISADLIVAADGRFHTDNLSVPVQSTNFYRNQIQD